MKITLVHDFLLEYGGAERVLEALHEIWPEAPIYTAFLDRNGLGPHWQRLKEWQIITSWGERFWFLKRLHSPLRFLAPYYFEAFNLKDYEVVISSTNAYMAKGIITRPETVHICYCHTPPRSLYGYPTRVDWKSNWLSRIYGSYLNYKLRQYDYLAAQRVDYFVANSKETQARIRKFYRRESVVIYPPVELLKKKILKQVQNDDLRNNNKQGDYYLYVGKLAMAKRVDLAIEACKKLKGPLKVVGTGAGEEYLRCLAGRETEFLGEVRDEELVKLYAGCKALIFPAIEEDFGIVPVEAMSLGKPVVAYRSGGVKETVVEGKTGVFFDELTVESVTAAINKLEKLKISATNCRKRAAEFSKARFKREIKELVVNKR